MLKRMSEGRSKVERVGNEKGGFVWGEKEIRTSRGQSKELKKQEKNKTVRKQEKQRRGLHTSRRLGNVLERQLVHRIIESQNS